MGFSNILQLFLSPNPTGNTSSPGVSFVPLELREVSQSGLSINGTRASLPPRSDFNCLGDAGPLTTTLSCATTLSNGAFIFVNYVFASTASNFTFFNYKKTIQPNVVSQAFIVAYWPPFQPNAVALALTSSLMAKRNAQIDDDWAFIDGSPIPGGTLFTRIFPTNPPVTTFTMQSTLSVVAYVTIYNFGVTAFNQTVDVTHELFYSTNSSLTVLVAFFPRQAVFPFFFYDPDIGVLLAGSTSGDGGGGFNDSLIAAIVVPVVVALGALALVIAIIAAILAKIAYTVKLRTQRASMIQF